MKRTLVLILIAVMLCGSLISCDKKGDKVSLGIGFLNEVDNTKMTADITVAAVVLDTAGKIKSCRIDVVQLGAEIGEDGQITAPSSYKTKWELGDDYGMKKRSAIGKEWYEQAAAFCTFVVGRTSAQVESLLNPETGKADDADLLATCSIAIAPFVGAVKKACSNAKAVDAKAADALKLGIQATDNGSANATEQKNGVYDVLVTAAAVTMSGEKVSASAIDASEIKLTFGTDGKSTVAADAAAPLTKREQGDNYGMKKYSGIGKEWYEQADAFSEFIRNRTLSQINGLDDGNGGKPTDEALLSGCTIAVSDFCRAVAKAIQMQER